MTKPVGVETLGKGQLLSLLESSNRLSSKLGLEEVLRSVLDIACEITGSTAGSVILHDAKFDDLYFAAATGPVAEELPSIRIPPGQGTAGTVFLERKPRIVNNIARRKDHYKTVDEQTEFVTQSMVCVPLLHRDDCIGVVQILNKADGAKPYREQDRVLLESVAAQSAIAIHNANQFERVLASSGLHALPEVRREFIPYLIDDSRPARNERLTVLFADMRGFTQLTTSLGDAGEIQEMLSEFVSMLANVIVQNHGIANKFLGDGVMAIFRGDAACVNAVSTAFGVVGKFDHMLTRWSKKTSISLRFLDIGVGIATGKVILGMLGNDTLREFTVMGTPVILASSLESQARGGRRILCDLLTFEGAKEMIQLYEGPQRFELIKPDQQALPQFEVFELKTLRSREDTARVFVCYHQPDKKRVVEMIVNPLKEHGFQVFFSDDYVSPGEDFAERIGQALADSAWFVVAATEPAVRSRWVREEVRFALEAEHLEGRILAARLDDVALDLLDWRLERRQHVTASGDEGNVALNEAFEKMREIVSLSEDT